MKPITQTSRIAELLAIGRMQKRRTVREQREAREAPLRDVLRDVPGPIWPAGDSGSQYIETLSCGHYRVCEPRCHVKAHRCPLCANEKAGV